MHGVGEGEAREVTLTLTLSEVGGLGNIETALWMTIVLTQGSVRGKHQLMC